MKKLLNLCLCIIIVSCVEENVASTAPIDDTFDTTTANVVKDGAFVGIGHTASGTATVYDSGGVKTVVLDPFSSQNGPDLKVYLSKDKSATSYIRLGVLKSTNGKQSYPVPGNLSLNEYQYVHIWCERFSVEFARAELK
jgi:hypothetical protein